MTDVIKRTIELKLELAFQKLDRALLKSPIGRIPELVKRPFGLNDMCWKAQQIDQYIYLFGTSSKNNTKITYQ